MSEVPIGAMVGRVKILSEEEAIEAIKSNNFVDLDSDGWDSEESQTVTTKMMTTFIERQNVVCGIDEIGQMVLYWHGSPQLLMMKYLRETNLI